MKKITNKVLWTFAVGQFGWSLLSGIITNWLVYYYTDETAGIFGGNESGEERSGMFFAARTFAMKMGQAISMLVFTLVVAKFTGEAGVNPFGYRLTAIIATIFCLFGAGLRIQFKRNTQPHLFVIYSASKSARISPAGRAPL